MKKFALCLAVVSACLTILSSTGFAGCPDDVFLFTKGSMRFDGPHDGRIHTPSTSGGQIDYYTVFSYKIVADLKATIAQYEGQGNCVDLGLCTDSSGDHFSVRGISVYDFYTVDKDTGEIQCDGNLLYSRLYQ